MQPGMGIGCTTSPSQMAGSEEPLQPSDSRLCWHSQGNVADLPEPDRRGYRPALPDAAQGHLCSPGLNFALCFAQAEQP